MTLTLFPDASDSCPLAANTNQADADGDSMGEACDAPLDLDDDDEAGGCCQTNAPPSPAGAPLLALGVLAAVRRLDGIDASLPMLIHVVPGPTVHADPIAAARVSLNR